MAGVRSNKPKTMHVRRLGPEDFERAAEAIRTIKEPEAHPSFTAAYLKRFLARSSNVLIVATQGDVPTGFLLAYMLDRVDRAQQMVCLYEIEVSASYRRQGIGRAMIETLKKLCKQEAVMETWLLTHRSNVAAVRLYERTGAQVDPQGDAVVFVYAPES